MTLIDNKSKSSTAAFVILTIMFFLWGLANNMTGTQLQNFRHILSMSDIQETIIKSAFYVAYFFAALPVVIYLYRRKSHKNGILIGLMVYAIGAMLFFPAASMESYLLYLVAIYVMATGCAMLETVANTYLVAGAPTHDQGVWRLNMAQSFNPLGSLLGILLCQWVIDDNVQYNNVDAVNSEIVREELDAITLLYAGVGEILLVVLAMVMFVNIRTIHNVILGRNFKDLLQSINRLIHMASFRRGAVALFVYVGAQTGVWGYTIPAVNEQEGGFDAPYIYMCSIIAFAVSRFVCSWLMKYYRYQKLLFVNTLAALAACIVILFCNGVIVVAALIILSGSMAMMFATIFGMSLENTGDDMQTGGALLVMTVVGGACLLILQGLLAGRISAQMSYILPAACFLVLVMYSAFALLFNEKK